MTVPLFIVDAFAAKPFTGNPAAICLLERQRDDQWMQAVAAEMNLSETAFVLQRDDGWSLRWFTPVVEVELCGHATLASAHVLWQMGRINANEPAVFHTRSGKLICSKNNHGITMDFPAEPPVEAPAPPELLAGVGVHALFVGRNRMDYFVQLDSERTVHELLPDLSLLGKVATRGIVVTARGSGECDFVSRAFFPRMGVPEDPVCGSAHCGLGPFWRERLGKDDLLAHQVSKRGGEVHVRCAGERIFLSGRAVTTLRGELV